MAATTAPAARLRPGGSTLRLGPHTAGRGLSQGRRQPYSRGARAVPTRAIFGDKSKEGESGKKPPSGLQVLLQKAFEGGKKASTTSDGFTGLMQSLGDGIVERNFGTGGSWPDAAAAKRKGQCPWCGASTAEALAAAEAAGNMAKPGDGPVELAALGQHPLGWCEECATKDRLLDVSKSF